METRSKKRKFKETFGREITLDQVVYELNDEETPYYIGGQQICNLRAMGVREINASRKFVLFHIREAWNMGILLWDEDLEEWSLNKKFRDYHTWDSSWSRIRQLLCYLAKEAPELEPED